jgi:hypothetical protein
MPAHDVKEKHTWPLEHIQTDFIDLKVLQEFPELHKFCVSVISYKFF